MNKTLLGVGLSMAIFAVFLLWSVAAMPHGGGVSSETGCHVENAVNEIHCHRGHFEDFQFVSLQQAFELLSSETDWTTRIVISDTAMSAIRGSYRCVAVFENDFLSRYTSCEKVNPWKEAIRASAPKGQPTEESINAFAKAIAERNSQTLPENQSANPANSGPGGGQPVNN